MNKINRKLIVSLVLALVLILLPASGVLAATSAAVTVTATPGFIGIANSPGTWTINGIIGSGVILKGTAYYANPLGDTTSPSATVVDGECQFTITNTSTIATDLAVNFADFTGGDAMTNSGDGTNTANTFGAWSYVSGMTYSGKVVAQATGSAVLKDALAATTDIKWGVEVLIKADDFTSATAMSSTITITATAD